MTPLLAPCYSEGSIVPEYDMLNGAMFIAVRGERAQISLTHSVVSCCRNKPFLSSFNRIFIGLVYA